MKGQESEKDWTLLLFTGESHSQNPVTRRQETENGELGPFLGENSPRVAP